MLFVFRSRVLLGNVFLFVESSQNFMRKKLEIFGQIFHCFARSFFSRKFFDDDHMFNV